MKNYTICVFEQLLLGSGLNQFWSYQESFLVVILNPIDLSLSWIRKCGVPFSFHPFLFDWVKFVSNSVCFTNSPKLAKNHNLCQSNQIHLFCLPKYHKCTKIQTQSTKISCLHKKWTFSQNRVHQKPTCNMISIINIPHNSP